MPRIIIYGTVTKILGVPRKKAGFWRTGCGRKLTAWFYAAPDLVRLQVLSESEWDPHYELTCRVGELPRAVPAFLRGASDEATPRYSWTPAARAMWQTMGPSRP